MREGCRLVWSALIGLFRSRASLLAEILVLRHLAHYCTASPNRSPPSRSFRFLRCAEPSPFAAPIHSDFCIRALMLRVINPCAITADNTLDRTFRRWRTFGRGGAQHLLSQRGLWQGAFIAPWDLRIPDPWRAADAWLPGGPVDGLEIHGATFEGAVANLEDFSAKSR
jgi:hypothetical protein